MSAGNEGRAKKSRVPDNCCLHVLSFQASLVSADARVMNACAHSTDVKRQLVARSILSDICS